MAGRTLSLAATLLLCAPALLPAQRSALTITGPSVASVTLTAADLDRGYICIGQYTVTSSGTSGASRTDRVYIATSYTTTTNFPSPNPASYTKSIAGNLQWAKSATALAAGANGTVCDNATGWLSLAQGGATTTGDATRLVQTGTYGNGGSLTTYVQVRINVGWLTDPAAGFPAPGNGSVSASFQIPPLIFELNGTTP